MSTLFDLPLHETFVRNHSETVEHTRRRKCPCGSLPDGSRSNINCLACRGRGLVEDAPVTFEAIVTGIRTQKTLLEIGVASLGDLVLSVPPFLGIRVHEMDKIRIVGWSDGELYEGETVRRDVGDTDQLRYAPVVVEKVFQVDPATGTVTTYTQGTHFSMSGKALTWLTPTRPAPGSAYTADYSPRWEWVAFTPTVHRIEQGDNLGQLVLLKKLHHATPF